MTERLLAVKRELFCRAEEENIDRTYWESVLF